MQVVLPKCYLRDSDHVSVQLLIFIDFFCCHWALWHTYWKMLADRWDYLPKEFWRPRTFEERDLESEPICLVTLVRISQSLLNCKIRAKGNKPVGADSECAKVHSTVASGWSLSTFNRSGSSVVLLQGPAEREPAQIACCCCCPGCRQWGKPGCTNSKGAFHGCLLVSLLCRTAILV